MNIISPSVELLKQEGREEGMLRHIERCARTCYKSEDKITDNSAEKFVNDLIKRGHTSMLEHGTVYLTLSINRNNRSNKLHYPWLYENAEVTWDDVFTYVQFKFVNNPYSVVKLQPNKDYTETTMYITTNLRVIHENDLYGIMHEFITEPTLYHQKRITLKFITNIGVTREGNRMRANSIAEESTRYCDYTKEKHGNGELNIVPPVWINEENKGILNYNDYYQQTLVKDIIESERDGFIKYDDPIKYYSAAIYFANICYNNLRRLGWTPQQAREVLPLATKLEVIYTATTTQWKHFFDLKLFGTTGVPHPNMKEIALKAAEVLLENNLWKYIYPNDENATEFEKIKN